MSHVTGTCAASSDGKWQSVAAQQGRHQGRLRRLQPKKERIGWMTESDTWDGNQEICVFIQTSPFLSFNSLFCLGIVLDLQKSL